MRTTRQVFDQFLNDLELTEEQRTKVSDQHTDLRKRLSRWLPGIKRDLLVGSYRRKTAIRPLNDIDIFLVLDANVHINRHNSPPQHILDRVLTALGQCYSEPRPSIRIQGRSANIEFSGTGIGYDIIPSFLVSGDEEIDASKVIYEIPDRERGAWIRTNPFIHRDRCVEANERAGSMLNRLVKAAKSWNCLQRDSSGHKPLRSFHLEVMAYRAFSSKPIDERQGLRDLFRFLSDAVLETCPDPAGLGPNIDQGMDSATRNKIRDKLQVAERVATAALRYEEQQDHAGACSEWRSILGSSFQRP